MSLSKSLRSFTLSSVHLDTDIKVELLTSFLGTSKIQLSKLTLVENQLTNLDSLLSLIYHNKALKELHILNQTYFLKESHMVEGDVKATQKENRVVERLTLSLGVLKTIKPLIRCFTTFTRLKEFSLSNIELNSKLHFQVIDNYLISNPFLEKLTLSSVKMGYD